MNEELEEQLKSIIMQMVGQGATKQDIGMAVDMFHKKHGISEQSPIKQEQQGETPSPELTFEQHLEANPNLKAFYDASADKQDVQSMFSDPNFKWDEGSTSFKDTRVLSDDNAAVSQEYWGDTGNGTLSQLLEINKFTRDDIAIDENGQRTIGGQTEITAPSAWVVSNRGVKVKEGQNYGDDLTIKVQDLDFTEWDKEEGYKKTLAKQRELDKDGEADEIELGIEADELWGKVEKKGRSRDDYKKEGASIKFRKWNSGKNKYDWVEVAKYKDGSPVAEATAAGHADAIMAYSQMDYLEEKKRSREGKGKKAAKALGARDMPKFTNEDLRADDSNIEAIFKKYTKFGFKFETSAWDLQDKITIIAPDGQGKLPIYVDRVATQKELDDIDKWMRARAIGGSTTLDAHLKDVSVTDEEAAEINTASINTFDALLNSTKDIKDEGGVDRSSEFKTVWSLYDLATKYKPNFDKSKRKIIPSKIGTIATESTGADGRSFYDGASPELTHAWKVAEQVAQSNFLDNYIKSDGEKLTAKEKRNFFTKDSVVDQEEKSRALAQIKEDRKEVSWDDPKLRGLAIETYNTEEGTARVRTRIADSVESMTSNIKDKAASQSTLGWAGKQQEGVLRAEQKKVVAEVGVINTQWKENTLQLKSVYEQIQGFGFDKKIKDIQSRDLTNQKQVDAANADIQATLGEYKTLVDKYESLKTAGGQLRKLAYRANKRIEEVSVDVNNLVVYQDYINDNHAIGTQMVVALTDAFIDLGQGLVGVGEMVADLGISAAGLMIDNVIAVPDDADPSIHAWAQWMQGGDELGGFERSHGWLDEVNDSIDGYQADRRERIQQVSFGEVKNAADFGEWFGTMFAGQIPNLALMATTGGASLVIMGSGAAGQKYNDLRASNKLYRESGGFYGTDHGFGSMFVASSLTGAAEALSEKITLGQVTAFKETFKSLIKEVGFKAGAKKYVKEVMFSPKALATFGRESFEEGFSESVATVSQNFVDMQMGDDVGLFDNVAESFVSGVMLSGALKSGKLAKHVKNLVASKKLYDLVETNHAEQSILENRLRTENLSAKQKDKINTRIAELTLETTEQLELDIMKVDALTDPHKKRLFEIDRERSKLQKEFNGHEDIKDPAERKAAQDITQAKHSELQAEKNEMLDEYKDADVKRLYEEDVKSAKDYAAAVEKAGGLKTEIQEGNSDDFEAFLAENAGEQEANDKFNYGVHIPIKDSNGKVTGHKIFINTDIAVKDGVFTTGAHEFLHTALYSTIQGDTVVAEALASGLIKAVGSDMTPAAKKIFDSKMGEYDSEKRHEETLTVLSEMLIEGHLKLSDSAWAKIADWIRQVFSRVSARDINFNNTDDVKKFLKDYSASVKGNYVDKGIVKMAVKGAGGVLVDQARAHSESGTTSSGRGTDEEGTFDEMGRRSNFSKAVKRAKDSNPDLKHTFDKHIQNEDGSRKFNSKDELSLDPAFTDAFFEIQDGKALNGLIQQGMTELGLPPVALREFTKSVKENLGERFLRQFDPAKNDSLFGWLTGVSGGMGMSQIYRAKGDIMNKYKKELDTVSLDAPMSEGQSFADTVVDTKSTAADTAVDRDAKAKGVMAVDTVGLKPATKKVIGSSVAGAVISLEDLTYKGVKKLLKGKSAVLAPVLEAVASEFGIPSKKIVENKDLDSKQRKAAQEFIKNNAAALAELLPEGETRSGEATGLPRMLLNKLYDKGDRVKYAEGASAAGKFSQTKRTNLSTAEFLSAFGVKEDGSFDNNKKHDGAIRAMAEQTAMIVANQAIRQEAINTESNPMRVIALIGEGKSDAMFSTRNVDRQAVGKINRELGVEASERFFKGLVGVVGNIIPPNNHSLESVELALRNEFVNDPEILEQVPLLAKRLLSAMKPMLSRVGVKNLEKNPLKQAAEVARLLQNQSFNNDKFVSAYTGNSIGAVKLFQDPKYKKYLAAFRATDKLQLDRVYDQSDIPGFFRWVAMLQQSSTTSPGRAQAYTDPHSFAYAWEITGEHVRFFTESLLISSVNGKLQIDKKTGECISSVDPALRFKLKKDGGVDTNTITHHGEKVNVNTKFAANTSIAALKDLRITEDRNKKGELIGKAKRRADEMFAREYLLSRFEFFAEQYKEGSISNVELSMLLSSELSSMSSALRRAAGFKYIAEGVLDLETGELRYEHMVPAVAVAISMMDAIIHGGGIANVHEFLSQYTVQVISKKFDTAITDSGNASSLPEGTDFNTENVNLIRNYNDKTLGDPEVVPVIDIDTNVKVEMSELHQKYNELIEKTGIPTAINADGQISAQRNFSKKPKGISVLDFDDTLATTKSGVKARIPNPGGTPKPGRKVIFMAGGAGSGKGNVISKLGLKEAGYKLVNSDISLEWLKKNHGLPENQSDYTAEQRSQLSKLSAEARKIAKRKQGKFAGNGDGVVVDGTGGSIKMMEKLVEEFKAKGYDVSMVFVETSLEVAQQRNAARSERSIREGILNKNHEQVQGNKEAFKALFGKTFNEVSTDKIGLNDALPNSFKNKVDDFTNSYENRRLDAEEFARDGVDIKNMGGEFDFSEFNQVVEGETAPLFNKAMKLSGKFGTGSMFILTARSPEAAPAIKEFLDAQGLNIPLENITGLGQSEASAKANWIAEKIEEGYNDFYFADDAIQNVDAVSEMLSKFDVKGKVQQARVQFSKRAPVRLSNIIDESIGVDPAATPGDELRAAEAGVYTYAYNKVSFSRRHRTEYEARLLDKNPTIGTAKEATAHVNALFKWLDSPSFVLGTSSPIYAAKHKSKFEKLALHYMVHNKLRLPEDGFKVIEAEQLAKANNIDPFSFKNPNDIIEKYSGEAVNKNPDPDQYLEGNTEVPAFENKRELKNGITIYNVQDTPAGKTATREMVNNHFGKKSNPWCIVQAVDGKLTDTASEYWDQYGTKQIIFKDGKLLAMRTESEDGALTDAGDVEFWSRNNAKFNEIPGNNYVDKQGRTVYSSFNERTGENSGIVYGATKGSVESGRLETYDTYTTAENKEPQLYLENVERYKDGELHGISEEHTNPQGFTYLLGGYASSMVATKEYNKGKFVGSRIDYGDGQGLRPMQYGGIHARVVEAGANEIMFSKRAKPATDSADLDLNVVLEQTKGVDRKKVFSAAKARKRGKNKGRFKFFVPPSADDFAGLMYAFMGKGKQGEQHHQFFKENLFDPFSKGIRHLKQVQQAVANDLKELRKAMPDVRKKLDKTVPGTEYTHEDAIRVYNWVKAGFEVPGLSKTDKQALVDAVTNDASLSAFAQGINAIGSTPGGLVDPGKHWLGGNIALDLKEALDVARGTYLQQWKENVDIMFNEANLNKIEAVYGSNFREALEDSLWRMEHGGNRSRGSGRLLTNFTNWIHGSIGTTMFLNARSAMLQMISNVNFVNWSDNNMVAAAKAFGNQEQYWGDVSMIFNSDFLKQRRSGIQTDVNAAELLAQIKDSKNQVKAATAYLLQLGFTPTQIADSFAIATGGATLYRNRMKTYLKEGMTQAEAETKAFEDMMEIAEETQQSTREDKISQQQASPLGKFILAFQNTPMQYNRIIKKASLDLVNGRGDPKVHISRIIYYGGIQNIIFYGLQQAMFAALFGDEEEEVFDKKSEKIMNGMVDTLLRGSGIGGAVVATVKNVILKFMKEEEKEKDDNFMTKANHANTLIEALNISPPIGIKARKLYGATQTWDFNRDVINHMSKTDIDNPAYDAISSAAEAVTNIPLSRLYTKYQNISESLNADNEMWQRVAMFLGWGSWSFGIENQDVVTAEGEVKVIKAAEAVERREMKKRAKDAEKQAEEEIVIESNLLDQKEEREEGQEDIKCAAVSKSGARCGVKVKGGGNFCTVHEKAPQRASGEKTQCSHVKPNGDRCKIQTSNQSGKCYYHD